MTIYGGPIWDVNPVRDLLLIKLKRFNTLRKT